MPRRHSLKDETCEEWLEEIKSRPRPRLLLEYFAANMARNTAAKNSSSNLDPLLMYCRHCNNRGAEGSARAFMALPEQLIFCTNRLRNTKEMEEVFVHEMIHAVDYCTRNMDLTKCEALACSEIRAAREAECLSHFTPKWKGEKVELPWSAGSFLGSFTKEGCTKRLATAATQAMFPGEAGATCVEKMFRECYRDTVPFEKST